MLRVSASSIKSWFQYRCERKLVYSSMSRGERGAVPILEELAPPAVGDLLGKEYERDVLGHVRSLALVLEPAPGEDFVTPELSLDFLAGRSDAKLAYQLKLRPTADFRRRLGIGDASQVRPSDGHVDLVRRTESNSGVPVFRIIDIKSTQVARVFHKAQVAWYALMLRSVLAQNGLPGEVDPVGEIWHRLPPGASGPDGAPFDRSEFAVRNYEGVVLDWAQRWLLPRFARREVSRAADTTFFHIYFKCEACEFLPHCTKAIDRVPPERMDLSAVPGLTHQSKATLQRLGLRTVGQLAGAAQALQSSNVSDWRLSGRGSQLVQRAQALLGEVTTRVDGRVTLRMPPRSHCAIILVADTDPVEGRLVSIGCRIDEHGRPPAHEIRLVATRDEELAAVCTVLAEVVAALERTEEANQRGAGRILHLFAYEPSESRDLAEALGRHLVSPAVREGLLEIVRLFPPQNVLPEPEYRGYHHLPAAAIRTVLEELYAIPVKVSYDLARVSAALANERAAPTSPYRPTEDFRRPFSARMSFDVARRLAAGTIDPDEVRRDVLARLDAVAGLVRWLESRNQELTPPDRFLRLNKGPFRLQGTVDPLATGGLELLRAQSLLEDRASYLATLSLLAQPISRRRERQVCFADLRLLREGRAHGRHWMLFKIPPDCTGADLRHTDPFLILSDGHPDRVLDSSAWAGIRVSLARPREQDDGTTILVRVPPRVYEGEIFRQLRDRLGDRGWVLDRAHFNHTSGYLQEFLEYLDEGAA